MKVTVIGLGSVGTVAAVSLAVSGHDVLATDVDVVRVHCLKAGVYDGYERRLADLLRVALAGGNIQFRHCDEVDGNLGDVGLIAVGTPPGEGYAPELGQVHAAIHWLRERINGNLVVAMKSTVPPEFLRSGQALSDWDRPYRIVVGTEPGNTRSREVLLGLYGNIDSPVLATDITTAEMIKYVTNAFLATRVSFMNEIAAICDQVGASIDDVREGLALDTRTGARIFVGVGYGGPCLPKDIGALDHLARRSGAGSDLLRAVIGVNERQWQLPLHALRDRFGGNLNGLKVAILGLTFKPGTNDLTEAPAVKLACALADEGARLTVYDPSVRDGENALLPEGVRITKDVLAATAGTQAAVVMTEWNKIVDADWATVSRNMLPPRFVLDGRNALDSMTMRAAGFEYVGIGRGRMPQNSSGY